ncbi:MAG: flippase-like domain-containing protein [Nitrospina sp.]|nr:flippase-like domain-containing protein [Nitrospina sp.]
MSYVFRAYRWQALLESSLKINIAGLYSPMMVGYLGNFLPARAAEILRPYLLSKKYNITFTAALASIVLERLFDMIILLLIFIWVFWFEADAFSSSIEFSGFSVQEMAIKFGQIGLLAVIFLMVFIYLLLNHKTKVMKIVDWFLGFMNEKWADKIKYLLDEFTMGCEVVKKVGTLAKISVYSVLLWTVNIFSMYPLYFAFDLQHKTISSLLILGVIVAILVSILPTPGFLGSYNAGILIALHEVMGESEIKSVSLGMVGWALFSGVTLVGGLYYIFHEHMSLKELSNIKRERDSSL